MRAFHFPLRQALDWRRSQLEIEETRLQRLVAEREQLVLAVVKLEFLRARAEQGVRDAPVLEPADLWALAAYGRKLTAELRSLEKAKRDLDNGIASQRQQVIEAQRRHRLLEKLEERRRAEWKIAADRETEALAAESFLANWNRR